jgi:hypothetical protein
LYLPASPQILLNIFEVNLFEKIAIDRASCKILRPSGIIWSK